MTAQDWAAIIGAVISGVSALAYSIKWLVKHYLAELKTNGGSSLKDQVNRLEARVETIIAMLGK